MTEAWHVRDTKRWDACILKAPQAVPGCAVQTVDSDGAGFGHSAAVRTGSAAGVTGEGGALCDAKTIAADAPE